MKKIIILLLTIVFIPLLTKAQIQMLDQPTKLASYESSYGSPIMTLYSMEPGSENDCTETCYFITYLDTEFRDNFESLFLGDRETALEFREIIYQSFSIDDFSDADDGDTKEIRFRIEDQTVTIVRNFSSASYFEHLERELPDRVNIWLNVNYEAYMGSTTNNSQDAWMEILEYFD